MNSSLNTVFSFLAFICFFVFPKPPAFAQKAQTLAIMHFMDRRQNPEWQWLSKGLSDMLITDLSRSGKFYIVDRERLQELIDEMNLGNSGIIDPSTISRVGQVAKVAHALFGSFEVSGESIEIDAFVLKVETKDVQRVESVKGLTKDILDLEKELAQKIIKNFHLTLSPSELEKLKYKPTDSIDASIHLYKAIEAGDQGLFPLAVQESRLSIKRDPRFEKAYLQLGRTYDRLGELEHEFINYSDMAELFPEGEFIVEVLWKAAGLAYSKLGRPEEALRLTEKIINNHPQGKPKEGTPILPERNLFFYNFEGSFIDFLRVFRAEVLKSLRKYKEALLELEAIQDLRTQGDNSWQDQIKTTMIEAHREASIVLYPKNLKIITFDPKNPIYEEDYSSDKRVQDVFQSQPDGDSAQTNFKLRRFSKERGKDCLCTQYDAIEKKGHGVTDIYYFAAPEGFFIESIDQIIDGYQENGWSIGIQTGTIGEILVATGSYTPGEVKLSRHFRLLPGTKLFFANLWLSAQGWKAGYGVENGERTCIDRWSIKANLIPDKSSGILKIESNLTAGFVFNPIPGEVPNERDLWWMKTAWLTTSKRVMRVPAGTYQVYGYPLIQGAAYKSDGQKQIQEVVVAENSTTGVNYSFNNTPSLILSGLPQWERPTLISQKADLSQNNYIANHNFRIKLLSDIRSGYFLVWNGLGDILFSSSSDRKKWSKPAPLPPPINSSTEEGQFSILQGEDYRYYLVFSAERDSGRGLFISVSTNMENWSNPRVLIQTPEVRSNPVLIQRRDGSFLVFYRDRYNITSVISSPDFKKWSEKTEILGLSGELNDAIEGSRGKLWMVLGNSGVLKISSSLDGLHWTDPKVVEPSISTDRSGSTNATIMENKEGELVLTWERGPRMIFSKSPDGINWSPSNVDTSNGWSCYPESPVSLVQDSDGSYLLAFLNSMNEIYVSESKNPFY